MLGLALAPAAAGGLGSAAPPGPQARPSIIGGGKANPRGFAFTVALKLRRYGFFCTGSLIAPDRVLTAAHCVRRAKNRRLRVLAGRPWSFGKRAGKPIPVRRVRIHPDYNPRKDLRDLAVITLERPAPAPTIGLASARQSRRATRPLKRVRSAGWGARSAYGLRLASRLKATKEIVYPNPLCRRFYGKAAFDPKSMVCALGKVIRRYRSRYAFRATSCSGDSGGPLVAQTRAGPRLVGVVSVGPLPCGIGAPSIYARTATSLAFVRNAAGL